MEALFDHVANDRFCTNKFNVYSNYSGRHEVSWKYPQCTKHVEWQIETIRYGLVWDSNNLGWHLFSTYPQFIVDMFHYLSLGFMMPSITQMCDKKPNVHEIWTRHHYVWPRYGEKGSDVTRKGLTWETCIIVTNIESYEGLPQADPRNSDRERICL